MTSEQYRTLMLESATHELKQFDKFVGAISGMKGNAKFDQVKQNIFTMYNITVDEFTQFKTK
jgi:hypothetical protein